MCWRQYLPHTCKMTKPDLAALQIVEGFLGRPPAMCWLQKFLKQSK